jgi:hypothetical protein
MSKSAKFADSATTDPPFEAGFSLRTRKRNSPMPARLNEGADDYPHVVARLNARWRVIECRDRIQWVLQYRESPETCVGARWASRSYFRTSEALRRSCSQNHGVGAIEPAAATILSDLPAWIEEPTNGGRREVPVNSRPRIVAGPPLTAEQLRLVTVGGVASEAHPVHPGLTPDQYAAVRRDLEKGRISREAFEALQAGLPPKLAKVTEPLPASVEAIAA